MLTPSRTKCWCGLSLMVKTMSAGIDELLRSPSRWKVTLVPSFHPGATFIVKTLSSFLNDFPSVLGTFLLIFIFLTHPLSTSSNVKYKSCSIGGSCRRPLLPDLPRSFACGDPCVKDCDRKAAAAACDGDRPNGAKPEKNGSSIESSKPLKKLPKGPPPKGPNADWVDDHDQDESSWERRKEIETNKLKQQKPKSEHARATIHPKHVRLKDNKNKDHD